MLLSGREGSNLLKQAYISYLLSLLQNYECRLSFGQDFRHPLADP